MALLDELQLVLRLSPDTKTLDATKLKFYCEQSERRKETVKQMMNLITECGYFIQCYAGDVNFRTLPSLSHSVLMCSFNVSRELHQREHCSQ